MARCRKSGSGLHRERSVRSVGADAEEIGGKKAEDFESWLTILGPCQPRITLRGVGEKLKRFRQQGNLAWKYSCPYLTQFGTRHIRRKSRAVRPSPRATYKQDHRKVQFDDHSCICSGRRHSTSRTCDRRTLALRAFSLSFSGALPGRGRR